MKLGHLLKPGSLEKLQQAGLVPEHKTKLRAKVSKPVIKPSAKAAKKKEVEITVKKRHKLEPH